MGDWLAESELYERFGESRVGALSDREHDGNSDAAVIAAAIDDAEGRVRSELRDRFTDAQLPADTGSASPTLKRLVAKLAFYYLHENLDNVSESVIRHRDDALAELRAIRGGSGSVLVANTETVDRARAVVVTSRRSTDLTDQRITLSAMENWGR